MNIASNSNYLTPEMYVSGRIVEYDLKAANINTMIEHNLISQDYYDYLSKLPKRDREIEVGLLIKDQGKSLYNAIAEAIQMARQQLFEANNISDEEVVRIANDAVYINRTMDLKHTKFGKHLEFRKKSDSFCMLNFDRSLQIFFSYVNNGQDIDVDVKGISKNKLPLHSMLLSFIGSIVYSLQRIGFQDAINKYQDFYQAYIRRRLDIGYYRELNSISAFNVYGNYLSELDDRYKDAVDINYNLLILRKLWKVLMSEYK